MKPWCALIVTALVLLPAPGRGQESLSLTLGEALALAQGHNPDLLAARQELEIARSRLAKARYPSQFNPALGGEVTNRSRSELGEHGDSVDFAVTLSQEIEIAGQRGKRIDEAERNLALVSQRVQDRERLILAQVKESFYRALSLRRRFDLFRQVEDLNRRLFDIATARFQAGEVPKMEVNLAEIRLGQTRKDVLTAERDYRNTLRELERLLGQEPRGTAELTGHLAVTPQTFDLQTLTRLALDNRPDLKAADAEIGRIEAEMALDYKGVSYEPLERCYSLDRKEDLRCVNLRAEVPTLVLDDGRTITDSTIIAEYLEEVYPKPPLYPQDPYERARMRTIEDLCDRSLDAVGFGFGLAVVREQEWESHAMKQAAAEELRRLLAVLERELGERNFFCDELSLADFAAICYVPGAKSMGVNPQEFPHLRAWTERMRRLPVVVADHERVKQALAELRSLADEFEGPDGRIHWRDSRLEWPIRHGFIDLVARGFHAGKMMFPPDAS